MIRQILPLDPAGHRRHPLHGEDRVWAETNCYVDVWVELLHAWGFDPVAALPFTLALDFEGDQWTFFKYPLADLYELYDLDVQELAVYRPLALHVEEQVGRGRPVLVELDSFYLPDTAGTAYRAEHVKSTVAVAGIDVEGRRLGYFHNRGYYHLEGEDFARLFRLDAPADPAALPPYVEFVKRRGGAVRGDELTRRSAALLAGHLRRLPAADPFREFKSRFEADLGWLAPAGLATFHAYSFATLRQVGACHELAASYLSWLGERTGRPLAGPAASMMRVATGAKTLQFQLARAMARSKPLGLGALDDLGEARLAALETLKSLFL